MSKKIEFEYKCFCCEKEIPSAGYCKACNDRLLDIELKSEKIYSSEDMKITALNKYFTEFKNQYQSFRKGLILISPRMNEMNDKVKEIAACYDEREVVYVYPGQIRIDKANAFRFSCVNFINKHTKLIVLLNVKKYEQIDVFPYITDGIPVKYNYYDEQVKIKPNFLVVCEMTNDKSILNNFGYSVKKREIVKPFDSLYARFSLLDCDIEAKEKFMREL